MSQQKGSKSQENWIQWCVLGTGLTHGTGEAAMDRADRLGQTLDLRREGERQQQKLRKSDQPRPVVGFARAAYALSLPFGCLTGGTALG